ncbi:hypothetical protein A3Q56_01423 [Intoshia linei]|uniref:Uncharacterized protein n=1 Tax=Intoshia linei TaxID=1819745 RepID=A0A177BBD6_9BILA|nr:hypothetical protein A3Q56_01423 [Intoshia linei]
MICYGKVILDCGIMKNTSFYVTDTPNILGCKILIESGAITVNQVELQPVRLNHQNKITFTPKIINTETICTIDSKMASMLFINPEFTSVTKKYSTFWFKSRQVQYGNISFNKANG